MAWTIVVKSQLSVKTTIQVAVLKHRMQYVMENYGLGSGPMIRVNAP